MPSPTFRTTLPALEGPGTDSVITLFSLPCGVRSPALSRREAPGMDRGRPAGAGLAGPGLSCSPGSGRVVVTVVGHAQIGEHGQGLVGDAGIGQAIGDTGDDRVDLVARVDQRVHHPRNCPKLDGDHVVGYAAHVRESGGVAGDEPENAV